MYVTSPDTMGKAAADPVFLYNLGTVSAIAMSKKGKRKVTKGWQ